jgi:hypothetical protein
MHGVAAEQGSHVCAIERPVVCCLLLPGAVTSCDWRLVAALLLLLGFLLLFLWLPLHVPVAGSSSWLVWLTPARNKLLQEREFAVAATSWRYCGCCRGRLHVTCLFIIFIDLSSDLAIL